LDDPVDAIAVHAGAGAMGVLIVPMFSGPDGADIWGQITYLVSASAFTFFIMLFVFLELDALGWLRCSLSQEVEGLTYYKATREVRVGKKQRRSGLRSKLVRPPPPSWLPWHPDPRNLPRPFFRVISRSIAIATFIFTLITLYHRASEL
jgi:hypothetical protein